MNNNQHDDTTPVQEMAAVLPIVIKHVYSKRIMAKGNYHEQLIEELTTFI